MKAAWYERQGPARQVLCLGEVPDPNAGPGEIRIRIAVSGVNPGDVKKRADAFGFGMPYPRIIPHSDGAGIVDQVGEGIDTSWLGRRVWCYGAQSYRPFGTAADYTVVPLHQAVPLPDAVSFEYGACLGIPGITAHRAVHVAGALSGKTVLIQGAAGAVGIWAVHFARQAEAHVIGVVRAAADREIALQAGADEVILSDKMTSEKLPEQIRAFAPDGVDHIVEVAFGANIALDAVILAQGGSIAAYATDVQSPALPFWPLVFMNASVYFLGSDDFPAEVKIAASRDIHRILESGRHGLEIAERFTLADIAQAHEFVERPNRPGRVVVMIK